MIKLAQECARLLDSGGARSKRAAARVLGITPWRVDRLLEFLELAPSIQRYLLRTNDVDGRVTEREMRRLASVPDGRDQVCAFRTLLKKRPPPGPDR